MDVRVGLWRKLSAEELMLLNCGVGEDSWESPGQSILKESNPEYSLEGLMLKLKLHQYFGHLIWRANSLEKTLMMGETEGRRRRGLQRMRCLVSFTNSLGMNLSKLREIVEDRQAGHAAVHGITKSWTPLSDWTTSIPLRYAHIFNRGMDIEVAFPSEGLDIRWGRCCRVGMGQTVLQDGDDWA